MNNISIEVFISTCNERILQLRDNYIFPPNIKFSIIHQIYNNVDHVIDFTEIYEFLTENNIRVFAFKEQGLSRSRNKALELAESDYVYLTDDDIVINYNNLVEMVKIMSNRRLDFLTGEVRIEGMDSFLKDYNKRNCGKLYNKLSSRSISSVELVLNRNFIHRHNIRYDIQFGLGSIYPSCEEYIFVTDIIDNEGKGTHYHFEICTHPPLTSGMIKSPLFFLIRGAMLRRVFNFWGVLFIPKFLLNISSIKDVYCLIKGFLEYKKG